MKIKTKLLLLSLYPIIVYFTIFNAMQWEDYEWQWSEKNSVLAWQYLLNGAWFMSVMVLAVVSVLYVMIILTDGLKP